MTIPCKLLSIFVALWFLSPVAVLAASPWPAVNRAVVNEHIIPRYRDLVEATAGLEKHSREFCAAPDENGLADLRAEFQGAMDAWMAIQHVRFGPVELYLRYNRFQLWPDKHNTAERQLNKALAEQDIGQLADDKFPYASVALQGLSAYERLLFDSDANPDRFLGAGQDGYPCLLLEAIAHNLARMSADVHREWTTGTPSYREIVFDAERGNSYFESSAEFSARMLNNLYTSLQFIVDQKLLSPLGATPAEANPRRAESWRSRRSLRNITLNLEAAESLYLTAYSAPLKADKRNTGLDREIREAFSRALEAAHTIKEPLYDALQSESGRQSVERLLTATSELKRLLGGPLPAALGLSLGFNSLDGD
ncbi:MAG: imelysin family protein [Gammaproteobacteria bacterium]|nr:imelysin family protein [Gammaproteobacteria bacterium]